MISIFVSSTFSDMQAERDVLRQRVLPRLQKVASRYGESVRIIDLRWGVNTTAMSEEQATKRIMDVCFEQIDKCNGRMVCLIGNRYGWVPNYDIDEIAKRYGLNLCSNVSATELEIQYGILQREHPQKAMVFMRDEINSLPLSMREAFYDDDSRLYVLKEELLKNNNCSCQNYSLEYENGIFKGLDAFEEMVYLGLCEYIVAQLDLNTVAQHVKIKNQFDALIDEETQNYYDLPQLDTNANSFVNSNNTFAVLKAEAGMGKTAFSSHMCKCWKNTYTVFYFFCGHSADCETPLQMLRYFINQISDYLGIKTVNNSSVMKESAQMFAYLIDQIKDDAIFLIDGIDHFVCSYEDRLAWLPERVPDHVKFVFTTSSQDKSYEKLGEYSDIIFLTIPSLKTPDQFIKHLLLMNGKDIQDEILKSALVQHNIYNYYHAKMIADALIMMDQYDFQGIKDSGDGITAINNFLKNALMQFPKSIEGVALFLLHDYGKRIAPDLIPEVYIYIACNEGGLRASDLEAILESKWDELSFERYITFLSGIIIERENGCYDFSSSIIRTAVEKLIKWKLKRKVIKHIETLANDDPLKLRCCLTRSLFYEHYDVVYKLIESNPSSVVLVEQFVGCLNYMENEISTLLAKYDLHKWFFDYVITRTTSIQEQDACTKIVLNILASIPKSFKATALEFLGDDFKQKDEFAKAEQYYNDALKELCDHDYSAIGRLYYKLARVICVNSEDEYERLRRVLSLSINNYNNENRLMDIVDRIYSVVAKYQFIMMELNHALNGVSSIQVFNVGEMRLMDGIQTPHLNYIARQKIGEIKEDAITSIKTTIDLFNEYRREAETIYKEAEEKGNIDKIIEPFIMTLNGYDIFGLSEARIERIREIKVDVEKTIRKQFSLDLYKTLGMLEYELANNAAQTFEKKQHLMRCCTIWGQFVTQLSLPNFSRKYINAEMDLVKIYLDAGDEKSADEHLSKWSQAQYDFVINELRHALNECRRYPDEIHLALLEEARDEIADVNRTKARIKQLGDDYNRCQDIGTKYFYHLIKSCVFNQYDAFEVRERFSFESYRWLKDVYTDLRNKMDQGSNDIEELEFVCIYILRQMLQMLELVSDIAVNPAVAEFFDIKRYYGERVFVLEERHRYEMHRLEKIWCGYMYAKALIEQASSETALVEQNCLFAIKIFNTLRRLLYENEVTPFNLAYPMISQARINFELCMVETTLASYYKEVGLLLSSAKIYETVTELALSLFGADEDSNSSDQLYLKIASASCLQALDIYDNLDKPSEVFELTQKYEAIKTLSLK